MPVYQLVKPILMGIDEERANECVIRLSQTSFATRLSPFYGNRVPTLPVEVFGKTISNPVGLAPGLDKDALALNSFSNFGFGFTEVGTVTPKSQLGNPTPRIFRIVEDEAIVNRLGFPSCGLTDFRTNLNRAIRSPKKSFIGVNLGTNKITSQDRAISDYVRGLEEIYELAEHIGYIVINISSPNTEGLRDLQLNENITELLSTVMSTRNSLASIHDGQKIPISIKVSPDLQKPQLRELVEIALEYKVDAITATNSTIQRPDNLKHQNYSERGGLSGNPLQPISNQIIRTISEVTQGAIPIFGVGGVFTAEDAWQKLLAGADLVQICSALVYRGPTVVRDIVVGIKNYAKTFDTECFSNAVKLAREEQST